MPSQLYSSSTLNPLPRSRSRIINLPAKDKYAHSAWKAIISETHHWYSTVGRCQKALVISTDARDIMEREDVEWYRRTFQALLETESNYIQDIRLFLPEQLFLAVYPLFTSLPFPYLKSFGISFYKYNEDLGPDAELNYLHSLTNAFGEIPSIDSPATIRELNLRDYFSGRLLLYAQDELKINMPWRNLTHLSIQESAHYDHMITETLIYCKNLRKCRLVLPGWQYSDQTILPTQVYLAHLTDLEIEVLNQPSMIPLLNALLLPSLSSLRLSVHPDCGIRGPCHAKALLDLHARHEFSLEKFVASGITWDVGQLVPCLRNWTVLRFLVLYGCSCQWETLFDALCHRDHVKDDLPVLQTLELSSDVLSGSNTTFHWLLRIYLSRRELCMAENIEGQKGIRIVRRNEAQVDAEEQRLLLGITQTGIPVELALPSEHNLPPLLLDVEGGEDMSSSF